MGTGRSKSNKVTGVEWHTCSHHQALDKFGQVNSVSLPLCFVVDVIALVYARGSKTVMERMFCLNPL